MSEPLAFLLTWTCYGTWLHGDERGSVTKGNNSPGTPFHDENPRWANKEAHKLVHGPVVLRDSAREIVRDAVVDHCRHRGWELFAVNARTNHVHAVIAYDGTFGPDFMLNSLKARATRCLRSARLYAPDDRVWTRHGSTRYLWNNEDVEAAVDYVLNNQGADVRFVATIDGSPH
jgi:REP element-mobilizing transposase RayT